MLIYKLVKLITRRIHNDTRRKKITVQNGKLNVPDHPIIPFIEGDGTGPDIWAAASKVLEAAVEKAYDGKKRNRMERSICW